MQPTRQPLSLIPVSFLFVLLLGFPLPVRGDRASCESLCIPPTNPIKPSKPLAGGDSGSNVSAYEPAQRAILLWNGNEEILFLSTDLSHLGPASLSEVIPLPAQPAVKIGSLDLFATFLSVVGQRGKLATEWSAFAPEGRLTNLRVVPIAAMTQPTPAVLGLYPEQYPSCFALRQLLARYQERGMGWLVFDDIEIRDYVQSFPPVEYRFRSDKVYYPLEISTMDHGETRVDLFVITQDKLNTFSQTDYPVQQLASFPMDSAELKRLSPDWSTFMGSKSVVVQHLRMVGDIRKMTKDFTAR